MSKEKRQYTTPIAEIIDLGYGESVLDVNGTHSVEGYKVSGWANVGEEGEDDEIILSNQTSLWN